MPERELTFAQAVREALAEEMRRDSRVCIFGEDVAEAGTPFKVLSGLVEEFGAEAPLLPAGGRALQEMTRISASPYSMWRDVAISNKKNLEDALWKVEQRLAHIRENLTTRQLADEFDQAHHLRKSVPKKK